MHPVKLNVYDAYLFRRCAAVFINVKTVVMASKQNMQTNKNWYSASAKHGEHFSVGNTQAAIIVKNKRSYGTKSTPLPIRMKSKDSWTKKEKTDYATHGLSRCEVRNFLCQVHNIIFYCNSLRTSCLMPWQIFIELIQLG